MQHIAVLIATRNRWSTLSQCLSDLGGQRVSQGTQVTLYVVDNGSTDGSYEHLVQWARTCSLPFALVVLSEPVPGKSRALNRGLDRILADPVDAVAFTDDDMSFSAGWVQEIVAHFGQCDCAGLAGAMELKFGQGRPAWFTAHCSELTGETAFLPADHVPRSLAGGNMAVRSATIRQIGRFREDLGPVGPVYRSGEDTEWSSRIIDRGEKLCFCKTAVNYHLASRWLTRRHIWLRQFRLEASTFQHQDDSPILSSLYRDVRNLIGCLVHRKRAFQGFDYHLEIAQRCGRIYALFRALRASPRTPRGGDRLCPPHPPESPHPERAT